MSTLLIEGLVHPLAAGTLRIDGLEVRDGERLVVFGPNGAGKSTLLRLLAGTVSGWRVVDAAYLPQRPYLFRGTAGWNLTLGLDPERRSAAEALAGRLGVAGLLERPVRTLSGGERQRLALARTLARPEAIVLLDEPLVPLDARDRMAAAGLIVEGLDGRTALIVTHDRDEAAVLGERMAVLIDGALHQIGTVSEVLTLPAGDEVAGAVGVANAISGVARTVEGPLAQVGAGATVIWGVGEVVAGSPAKALFGAETVTLFRGGEAMAGSARNRWPGRVAEVRSLGRLTEVIVDAGIRVAALVTPGSMEALGITVGSEVTVAVKATAVRVVAV
ncbi:MAG: ATP-binding cassette domain-containing protein [Acidimicrobiia bacterium]